MILGIPWPGIGQPILGVVPVLLLLFFVRTSSPDTRPQPSACTRCASPHAPGQNFCTKCGWDLSHEYIPEGNDTVLASEMRKPQGTSTATVEKPSESPPKSQPADPQVAEGTETVAVEPTAAQPREREAVAEEPAASASTERQPATADISSAESAETSAAGAADASVNDTPTPEPEPEEPVRPWGIPQPGPAPTAAVMTARGEALLSEGKLQEAIDQFTKAIALDPKHREAFERRAEAYAKQGRDERAEEDYRRVQALNTGS